MTSKNNNGLLALIDDEINGIRRSKDVEVGGRTYTLRVATRDEESMARALNMTQDNADWFQAMSDLTVPTLAIAIQAIEGQPVEELFGELPTDDEARQELLDDPGLRKRWMRKRVMDWLGNKPEPFVAAMWLGYDEIRLASREALRELGPLSTPTPSLQQKPM